MLMEQSGARDFLQNYQLPPETLRRLGLSDERLAEFAREVANSAGFRGFFASRSMQSLTSAEDYVQPEQEARAYYSPYMTSPAAYFAKDEMIISSVRELFDGIAKLVEKTPNLRLVWRGHKDADWGIHNSLFRHLRDVNGVIPPTENPTQRQPYPDEDQMVRAEIEILCTARTNWRFDGMSALETFARIQHAGGPTRLLDVTKNPYVAAWFAVEADKGLDDADARMIAFATGPVAQEGEPAIPDPVVQLDAEWGDRAPAWHALPDSTARQGADWGTGARRRLWVPPTYDPRILSQNAAFLLDGVPISTRGVSAYFRNSDGRYWSKADLLASASFFVKTAKPTVKPRRNSKNLAPTFTFRITAAVKRPIREFLETRFGFTKSYIYPDVTALAQHLNSLPLALPLGRGASRNELAVRLIDKLYGAQQKYCLESRHRRIYHR